MNAETPNPAPYAVLAVKPGCRCEQGAQNRREAECLASRLSLSGWATAVVTVKADAGEKHA